MHAWKKINRKTCLGTFIFLLLWSAVMPHAHGKTLQGVVNVNTATPEQLELLPGIGQAKAQAIVERRQTKPFASLEDLAAVKGLGKKRREALRPHVTFSGPTTAQEVDAVQSAPAPDGKTGTP